MAAPRQHHVRQAAIEIGDRFLKPFGMSGTCQSRRPLRVECQVRLSGADHSSIAVKRGNDELSVVAVDPFHVPRLAVDAQENMIRHAGRGIARVEPASCAVGQPKPDLCDVMNLSARHQGAYFCRNGRKRQTGSERYQMMRMRSNVCEDERGTASVRLEPPAT